MCFLLQFLSIVNSVIYGKSSLRGHFHSAAESQSDATRATPSYFQLLSQDSRLVANTVLIQLKAAYTDHITRAEINL